MKHQPDVIAGTEHLVELDPAISRISKITVPPYYGLAPAIRIEQKIDLRGESPPVFRQALELVNADLLTYLERWIAANQTFGDEVHLNSIIEWPDQTLSLGITQPQYHGVPASPDEIRRFFLAAGWDDLTRRAGRSLYYHFGFNLLAVDAEPRNCFRYEDAILPFDVVLCHPNEEIADYLKIFS